MTGQELIDALERTGTGETKLALVRPLVERKPDADDTDVLAELAVLQGQGKVGAGTVAKARQLMGGAAVKEFLGTPPKNAEEARLRTLGKEIGAAITEQLKQKVDDAAADGIGGVVSSARAKR